MHNFEVVGIITTTHTTHPSPITGCLHVMPGISPFPSSGSSSVPPSLFLRCFVRVTYCYWATDRTHSEIAVCHVGDLIVDSCCRLEKSRASRRKDRRKAGRTAQQLTCPPPLPRWRRADAATAMHVMEAPAAVATMLCSPGSIYLPGISCLLGQNSSPPRAKGVRIPNTQHVASPRIYQTHAHDVEAM